MAGEHNDQGRERLDGDAIESAQVLMRPISVAVEIVEPQKNEEKSTSKPEVVKVEDVRGEVAPVTPARPPDPMAGPVAGFDAAARRAFRKSADLSGDREGQAIRGEYLYSGLGLMFSVAAIMGGAILALHGIADGSSWTAKLIGLQSELRDTGPGVFIALVGAFVLWTTRPVVRLKDLRPR